MIRAYADAQRDELMELWLASTIPGQDFLSEEHWRSLVPLIRDQLLPIAETWVVTEEGRMVAFASILGDLVGGLFTHPEHQGQGHGRALIEHAQTLHDPLRIEVFRVNTKAKATYEHWGFVEERAYIDERTDLEAVILVLEGAS